MVTGPQYTVILASDVEASTAFYETHMGWSRSGIHPMGGEMFNVRPSAFIILPNNHEIADVYSGPRVGYGMQLSLNCDDVHERFDTLSSAGVDVVYPVTDTGFQTLFAIRDLDGYIIVLAQDNL